MSSRMRIYRILYMWDRQVWAATGGVVNLDTVILNLSYHQSLEDLFSPVLEAEILRHIVDLNDPQTFNLICRTCPLRVSPYPVEVIARLARK
jgi:hypothetical protein